MLIFSADSLARSPGSLQLYSELKPLETELVDGRIHSELFRGANRQLASDDEFDEFSEFSEDLSGDGSKNQQVYDPWIGYNRTMFAFNDWAFRNILRPFVDGYNFVLPESVRISLAKFFHNLIFPLRFVNNILQLKFKGATVELGRFVVNTTIGIGGLFDPADHYFGWMPHEEDFGQTLAFWGVGPGPPVVLPFLGQSNLRDTFGIFPTYIVHPVYHVADYELYLGEQVLENLNFVSLHYQEYESIKKDALDPYTFIRDAYAQNRQRNIEE